MQLCKDSCCTVHYTYMYVYTTSHGTVNSAQLHCKYYGILTWRSSSSQLPAWVWCRAWPAALAAAHSRPPTCTGNQTVSGTEGIQQNDSLREASCLEEELKWGWRVQVNMMKWRPLPNISFADTAFSAPCIFDVSFKRGQTPSDKFQGYADTYTNPRGQSQY